jgi:RND family efflux transporter MFP subunit
MARRLQHSLPIVSVCAALATTCITARIAPAQGPPAALVVVSPAVEREVAAGQAFVGTVMPLRTALVGSAVDGRVIEFPLDEGDRVDRGGMLAQLLTDTIQLELAAAEAELVLRQQALAELENGTRPAEIQQMKARMAAAQARSKYAQARRARAGQVGQAMSDEEREEMIALAVEADQAFLDAKAAYELAVEGPRKEQVAQARAQVAVQHAIVDQLKDQIEKHTVIARFAGYVTAEHTEVGQWVKQGDPVAEVAALDEIEVVAQVVEQYVPHTRVGTTVSVEIPALKGRPFIGIVSAVVPQADVQARTFPVKVRVKNQITADQPLIKPGMYARVMLPTGEKQKATVVFKDALVLGGPQPVVYVVDAAPNAKQGKVHPVNVKLGVAEGNMIQVSGDLKAGQLVVVQGNERLRPGIDVQIQRLVAPAEAFTAPGSAGGSSDPDIASPTQPPAEPGASRAAANN